MAVKGTIKLTAGDGLGATFASTGISASSGATGYEVQVFKVAWGSTGEFKWVDDSVSSTYSGPLPVQLLDNTATPFSSTAISGSSNKMLDVNIRNQGGSASSLAISSPLGDGTIAVAGTSGGHYISVAGSTSGGAIPHIGGTSDKLSSLTAGSASSALAKGPTGAFSGTVSAKLRSIAGDIHQLLAGGTGADGNYRTAGINSDIRSFASGVTLGVVDTSIGGGFTYSNSIQSIAGGVTIGIASVQVDNPVVIGANTAITGGTGGGSGWGGTQIRTASTALVSGVRIKNTQGSGTLTVSFDALAGSTSGMTSGWNLDDREEVFIEVDNLNKVYVRSSASATAYSYYAT